MSLVLKPLKCSKCGAPLKAKEKDRVLYCEHCGTMSLYASHTVSGVNFRIAAPGGTRSDPIIYVPFWVVNADVIVEKEKISGGGIRRIISKEEKMSGNIDFYVCASSLIEEADARGWNMNLTMNPPVVTPLPDFKGGKRAPLTMDKEIAKDNAEFLYLRHETELPGTFQGAEYTFTVRTTEVLYLPVYKTDTEYILGA